MTALRTLLVSLFLAAAGIAVLAGATDGFQAFTTETARRIDIREQPRTVPPITLQTATGTDTSFANLRGRWLLVDFIYTRCTTYCTVQGGEFAKLQHDLAVPIATGKLQLLSVSFDPAHDAPPQLADYQRRFGDRGAGWLAVRPTNTADLATLMRVFGVVAVPDGLDGFVHNAAIAVVDPDGRLVAILDWDDPQGAARYVMKELAP